MGIPTEKWPSILRKIGVNELNRMQSETLESAHTGNHIQLTAPTGSGKTLAFLLPILQNIDLEESQIQALLISPTRELAMQIHDVIRTMGTGIAAVVCYGGHPIREEMNALAHNPQLVIGTPGRLHDHLRKGNLDLGQIKTIVLDEFDKTLELGFNEDVQELVTDSKQKAQMILTSATSGLTLPDYLDFQDWKILDFLKESVLTSKLKLYQVDSPQRDKIQVLADLLCQLSEASSLVFLNHRAAVERVHSLLEKRNIESSFFHGGLDQVDREITLMKFRNGSIRTLITTDLGARGLDIPSVEHVIHYQIPLTEDVFIHRNGRTARMNASGSAFVIVSEADEKKDYLPEKLDIFPISKIALPPPPDKITLALNRGKRDKISKMDVLGFLTKIGGLQGEQVGLINIKTRKSYAAIDRSIYTKLITKLSDQKIKGKSVKITTA